jgi:hypothetical protein
MFQSSDHRYFYEIKTAHSRTLMVFDRCSQRSYTSSNNKTLNACLLARRHKFVTGATLLQLVLHQCMNATITRTCRASNTSVNPLTSLLNSLPTNISSAVFPAHTPESTKRSRRPPSAQSFPIEDKKQDKL